MKNLLHFLKRMFQNLFWASLMILIAYAFLGLCNWSSDLGEWNGFSRFLFAVAVIIVVVATWDAMATTIRNITLGKQKLGERIL